VSEIQFNGFSQLLQVRLTCHCIMFLGRDGEVKVANKKWNVKE